MARRASTTGRGLVGLALGLVLGLLDPVRPSVVGAETVTGFGPTVGCRAEAFEELREPAPLPLALIPVPVLRVTLAVPCPGLLLADGVLGLALAAPPPGPAVVGGIRVTCLAGGCPVTGTPLPSSNGSILTRASGTGTEVQTLPVAGAFPDLPAGIYLVELVALAQDASLLSGALHVEAFGGPGGSARTPEP